MNKRVIAAAVILALVCVGGIVMFVYMRSLSADQPMAQIFVDNTLVKTVELSEDMVFTINTEQGYNEVKTGRGQISVIAADCPDKVCVHTGPTSSEAVPIICLPHRLEIRIVSAEEPMIDAEIN